jgi:hypothetical protein
MILGTEKDKLQHYYCRSSIVNYYRYSTSLLESSTTTTDVYTPLYTAKYQDYMQLSAHLYRGTSP